jgi:hypothetical protein
MTEESGMWKIRVKKGDRELEVVGSNKDDVRALFVDFERYVGLDM